MCGLRRVTAHSARIALGYLLVAVAWMVTTDVLVGRFGLEPVLDPRFETYSDLVFIATTAALLFWVIRRDLKERRQHTNTLELFIEHAPVGLVMMDRDLRYIVASKRWALDHGLARSNVCGKLHYDLFPETPTRWRGVHRRVLSGETLREESERIERADGSVHWSRWEARPWRDSAGTIGGIVMFTEDITARKLAEGALMEAQSKLRLALECGRVGTWSWELETGAVDCDEALARILGRPVGEIAGGGAGKFLDFVHPDDRGAVEEAMSNAFASSGAFAAEFRIVRPNGAVFWVAARGRVDRTGGSSRRMIGATVDITEIRNIESNLHAAEDRFRELVETINEVFWIQDVATGRLLYVSPGYEKIWGRSCEEAYVSQDSWLEAIVPEDRDGVRQADADRVAGGLYKVTYRINRPDGTMRWISDRGYPVRDETGTVIRFVGSAADITERKSLEEQFLHAQRLEAIGTLASGVAHDLNNILAPMMMAAPMLRAKLKDSPEAGLATIVERSAERGAAVVRQLLTFGRGVAGEKGPLQTRHLVKEMVAIASETFPRMIGISHSLASDLHPVIADATQIHQVLMNLCVNARDSMPDGGQLAIRAENVTLEPGDVILTASVKPGTFVKISVSDTGQGIPDSVRKKIFEPFFTTKPIGKGTGLGLATVLGIVKGHGGLITLDSRVGEGTSFHVYLPCAKGEVPEEKASVSPNPEANGEMVLVVEDEPAVRMVMRQVLERKGYKVAEAANGREGLSVFMLQREHLCAVVTDLMMPEMDGLALVGAIRELDQDIPILAATGLQEADQANLLSVLGVAEILPKPYTPHEILSALKRCLERKASDSRPDPLGPVDGATADEFVVCV